MLQDGPPPPRVSRRRLLQTMLALMAGSASVRAVGLSQTSAPGTPTSHLGKDASSLLGLVNPMQGTDSNWGFSRGSTLPLVTRPFAMTNWSPQNGTADGWFFNPSLLKIQGIRATHQPSPWMGDYGHFTVMAQAGDAALAPEARATSYSQADLQVHPHSLSLLCLRDGVRLEMAPTERCAIFRFTFPDTGAGKAAQARVLIDAQSQVAVDAAQGVLTGFSHRKSGDTRDKLACYFHAEFDRPFEKAYPFQGGKPVDSRATLDGADVGVAAEFGAEPSVVLRMGTSFISVDQARRNLHREIGTRSLETVRREAAQDWETTLGVVRVSGGTLEQRRTFYSCLYRAHLFPRMFYEHDDAGQPIYFSPYDNQVHSGVMYADTGLWDGYHTVYPLLSLLQPQRLGEMMQGFVNAYRQGGWLPQWPSPGYRGGMGGTHSDVVLADAILKDIPGFDRAAAYAGMLKNATVPPQNTTEGRGGLTDYLAHGYIPIGKSGAVVSNSLDFIYDDACISLAAARLGHSEDQRVFAQRALNYRLLFDPETGFMRGRNADGTWSAKFDEFAWGDDYTEGGPWQWTWSVPHDPAGLMTAMGGQKAFVRKLDRMLWQPPLFHVGGYGREIHEMSEMGAVKFGQYDQGNQPAHQALGHYAAAGCPSRMHYWSRRVLDRLYSPDAFPGDEDNGEMASWYVLSALGLFPHCPGRPTYALGSPLFPKAVLRPPQGKPLVLSAPGTSREAVYVTQVTRNGRRHDRLWIAHAELAAGGRIEFSMAKRPLARRLAPEERLPSFSAYAGMAPGTEAVPVEVSINCGGDAAGSFVGDCFVEGGQAAALKSGRGAEAGSHLLPDPIRHSERRGTFTYKVPMPMPPAPLSYTVRLHFAAGAGEQEIRINNAPAHSRTGTDSESEGAVVEDFSGLLPDRDGEIVIAFAPTPGSPASTGHVSGLEIFVPSQEKEA